MIKLYNGDCLEVMNNLVKEGVKVDFAFADLPYGITRNKWDIPIPFVPMWNLLNKITKVGGGQVFTATQPFSSLLVASNLKNFSYEWVWIKSKITGVLNAKKMPVRKHEQILVFNKPKTYNPQGLIEVNKITKQGSSSSNYGKRKTEPYLQRYTNYPRDVIEFSSEGITYHPTQKPVALMEYLVKTYTNEGDTVLDFTTGSGTTGVACKNLNRNFIGIELDKKYFDIAQNRLDNTSELLVK